MRSVLMSVMNLPDRLGAVQRLLRNTSPPIRRLAIAALVVVVTMLAGLAIFPPRIAMAANHTIVIRNFAFSPDVLNVAPGDTVTFINQETDGTLHTIRGDFTSPDLPPGASFTVTITGNRSYSYF